jgi:DNA (cytosine-5)-methyltransferase 1
MPGKLRTLDLFTGIGGATRALSDMIEVVAYCDNSKGCQEVLTKSMERGDIPIAPILGDIQSVGSHSLSGPVDFIVSGFPCQGLSSVGKRRGLQDARSGLFHEVLRLIDELQPKAVFFENVPNIVRDALDTVVDELFFKRGLELRWSCMRASDCGAPHARNRWFCLALQPGFIHKFSDLQYTQFDWSPGTGPERLLPPCVPSAHSVRKSRCQLLENSVVPDAVRAAFIYLCTGFETVDVESHTICIRDICDAGYAKTICESRWPLSGHISDSGAYIMEKQPASKARSLGLLMIGHEELPGHASKQVSRPIICATGVVRKLWATPRHGLVGPSKTLTERTICDLPTQLRFEIGTPESQKRWYPNPQFIEWMMGYPINYTS